MKRVLLGSIFRNSAHYVDRYFAQVNDLSAELAERGIILRLVLVEGDSVDRTWAALFDYTWRAGEPWPAWGDRLTLLKREHGGPPWGSVDDPARWRALAWCANGVLEGLRQDDDAVIYVESDLLWGPQMMCALLGHLERGVPAVAPLCFTTAGNFYDIYGHRGMDGVPFSPLPPYHSDIEHWQEGQLVKVRSAGSCVAMRPEVARYARFGEDPPDCVLGLGRTIWSAGYSLSVDPTLRVVHP
jgi:hypothetical protein